MKFSFPKKFHRTPFYIRVNRIEESSLNLFVKKLFNTIHPRIHTHK